MSLSPPTAIFTLFITKEHQGWIIIYTDATLRQKQEVLLMPQSSYMQKVDGIWYKIWLDRKTANKIKSTPFTTIFKDSDQHQVSFPNYS